MTLSNLFKKNFISQKMSLGDDKNSTLEFVSVLLGPKSYIQSKTDLFIPISENLVKYFVVNLHNQYRYITQEHLNKQNIKIEELENRAIQNVTKNILENNNRGLNHGTNNGVHMFYDKNNSFELYSSLILNPLLWKEIFLKVTNNSPVFCIPSKFMLALTDSQNKDGIKELKRLADVQVGKNIEETEFVSNQLFTYQNGEIKLFQE